MPKLVLGKPKCNAILNLFGKWLLEGAFIGTNFLTSHITEHRNDLENKKFVLNSIDENKVSLFSDIKDRFECGRAEAFGAICRIIDAKKSTEDILPIYLARYYLALIQGLCITSVRVRML